MVANPMQKKARNSFLAGVAITLIICALLGIVFYFLVVRQDQIKDKEEGVLTYAYRLKADVKSGEEITADKVEEILVKDKVVPAGAFPSRIKTADGKDWTQTAFPTGYKSKLDLNAGTILANSLVYEGEERTNDLRYAEYNMLMLPTTLQVGTYIDIRITFPNGQDFIVASKKQVKSILGNTIGIELSEEEILMMESAIVEAYIMKSSKIYAIQYVEPGNQEAAVETYTPTDEVKNLITINPNIKNEARQDLLNRFDTSRRQEINNEKNSYQATEQQNLEEKVKQEIENAKAAREAYLAGLTSY